MKFIVFFISAIFFAFQASCAEEKLASVQTKLSLLGYDPGPADGIIGKKTKAALKAFDNKYDGQELKLDEIDSKLTQKINKQSNKQMANLVFSTTSNFTEMANNKSYFLMGDEFYKSQIEPEFNGPISKWYFVNVVGDEENELVVFGINDLPLVFRNDVTSKIAKDCQSGSKILVFQKVKETYNGDIRYQKLDSDEVFGKNIRSYGDTVTLTSDFNGDGYNDFFIPSESDVCATNLDTWFNGTRDVLLMSKNGAGYEDITDNYKWLINDTFRHWAASGDIDNDGDIDFITSHLGKGGKGDRVECYFNDGKGNFDARKCVEPPKSLSNKNRSWGGALMDLNNDGRLDLVYSGNAEDKPSIMLGDGTGFFDGLKSVQLYLPKNWKSSLRQFGGLWVADVDGDGWQDLLFSVQGTQKSVKRGTKCRGYCGTAAGWFRNDHGFLDFQEYFLEFEPDERFQWPSTSLFSVGNYIRRIEDKKIITDPNRPKDIWLRRNYYGKSAPFFQLNKKTGKYEPTDYDGLLITLPRIIN